jgi:uncharacterized protein
MKYLVVLLVVGVGLWMLLARSRIGSRKPPAKHGAKGAPTDAPAHPMVACAHCGLHLPETDALQGGGQRYCSEAHRALGPPPP